MCRSRNPRYPLHVWPIVEFSRAFNKRVVGIKPSVVERLTAHTWPGNVRELRHTIERVVLLAERGYLSATGCGLGDPAPSERAFRLPTGSLVLSDVERSLVLQALQATEWNLVRAGRLLGLNRDQVRYRIEKFGLVPDTEIIAQHERIRTRTANQEPCG